MSDERRASEVGRQAAILDAFVHLSDTLVDDYDVIDFLHYLTDRCVDLAGVDEAAVMLATPAERLQAVASSSERSRNLELFELQNQDGPCLDAFNTGAVRSGDLRQETARWPLFAPRAIEIGFLAVHSVPLRLRNTVIGALNLLLVEVGELDEPSARLVRALADIATVGVLQERLIARSLRDASGLQAALLSRIRIEQAKGVLAERHAIHVDEAFARLRHYARSHQSRLTDVATAVVERHIDVVGD